MNSSGTDHLYPIEACGVAATSVIGAKARSLQQMAAHGLPVPSGVILATHFFQPWFDLIEQSPAWIDWRAGRRDLGPALCAQMRAVAATLPLSDLQLQSLLDLSERLAVHGPAQRFAVRSSSPDEDTEHASFAGLFETCLGVAQGDLHHAIRQCFSACLDYRVFSYKAARGVDLARLSFALIVQVQIDSEAAGVGFSINPPSNDYDEAIIAANWGLGESVVSGVASPDHFVVSKIDGRVIDRMLGAKQLAVSLAPEGGTRTAPPTRRDKFCISDQQIAELSTAMCELEAQFGLPIDMEWAFSQGKLFVLQARPITSYVPLPPDMISAPGSRRTLYTDVALSKGMTSNAPISPIGLDWLARDITLMVQHCIGNLAFDVKSPTGLLYLGGARMYMNLSNLLWFSTPAQLAKGNAATDSLTAATLAGIDPVRYRAAVRPAWMWPVLRRLPGTLWRLRRPLWRTVRNVLAPQSSHRLYLRQKRAFEERYAGQFDNALSVGQFQRRYGPGVIAHVIDVDMPALGSGIIGMEMLKRLVRNDDSEEMELAERLTRGIGGNVVVVMGMRIFRMAHLLDMHEFDNVEALGLRLQQRQLPARFLAAWDQCLIDYGCRGPGEMDMANPHYADDPMLLLRQMASIARGGGAFNPEKAHEELAAQRADAYDKLYRRLGWARRLLLKRANNLIALFGGTRDTPKQHNLMYQHGARARLLLEGERLCVAGRLDRPEQVFDLLLSDLEEADADASVDLRARGEQRTRFARTLKRHVRSFPSVIDSRGRIQRPPARQATPGELWGMAVSPGVTRGHVKVLHNAQEKPINSGDVLVAFTTDPGWTPLFVNAAAVVLEVGGLLQHGAVVAREFGKPCVAGVADVLTRFVDGQLIEVDGNTGVVRLITDGALPLAPESEATRKPITTF